MLFRLLAILALLAHPLLAGQAMGLSRPADPNAPCLCCTTVVRTTCCGDTVVTHHCGSMGSDCVCDAMPARPTPAPPEAPTPRTVEIVLPNLIDPGAILTHVLPAPRAPALDDRAAVRARSHTHQQALLGVWRT